LNQVDNRIRNGETKAILRPEFPATLGSDVAGRVAVAGRSVTRLKPGDSVFASVFGLRTGALAELAVVPESAAAPKPARLDFVQAASIPMVGLTSWQALRERADIKPGQKVFIPAGAGGIGTFSSWTLPRRSRAPGTRAARERGASLGVSLLEGGAQPSSEVFRAPDPPIV
jgi:NADPH:quinone reductase-like Zn-dependent oxidoreductase